MMLIVILGSILFTFVIAAAQVYFYYYREIDLLNARLQQIRVIEVPSLVNSVWHFDTKQIETQLQGMLNLQDIGYVELQVEGEKPYTFGQMIPEADRISQIVELEYTQKGEVFALGQLQVMADLRSLQQRVLSWLFRILSTAAIQIFLLAGFILWVVDRLLNRPLNDIVRYAEILDLDHLEEPLVLQHRKLASSGDELELVALKLNEMRCRLIEDVTERKYAENVLLAQNQELIAQGCALEKAEAQTRQLNAELEKRVKERTVQLTALNQELEAFSYSVAHDLRAPLRQMSGFSQIIIEDYGDELNVEVKKWLERIQNSAQNLMGMVDALLALSRVTREEPHLVQVDLSKMAQTIAENLHQHEPERQVEFVIAPDLTVQADQHLLHVVLENLLGNAWKFTAQSQPARIELGRLSFSETEPEIEDTTIYFVRDNGAGFDPTYANRLFSPFQRLHSASLFSGTGIGLATVKRIIQRHGGRVWAEGAVDQGAAFYFSFPA
jgi:signal transduction histidine kinase